jgi:hypothetical protein
MNYELSITNYELKFHPFFVLLQQFVYKKDYEHRT